MSDPGESDESGTGSSQQELASAPADITRKNGRRTLLIGAVGLAVIALATTLAIAIQSGAFSHAHQAGPKPSQIPHHHSSPSSDPSCTLKVLDTGFSVSPANEVHYGLLLKNPCTEASLGAQIVVHALDKQGHQIETSGGILNSFPDPVLIMPDKHVNIAGQFNNGDHDYKPEEVSKLRISFESPNFVPANRVDAHRTMRADFVSMGSRNSDGYAEMIFSMQVQPEDRRAVSPVAYIILRDSRGKILGGEESPFSYVPHTSEQKSVVWLPPRTDPSRTAITVFENPWQ